MKKPIKTAEDILNRLAKVKRQAAEATVPAHIGSAVLVLLKEKQVVSFDELIAWFEQTIAESASVLGTLPPEQDITRIAAEVSIMHLRSALAGEISTLSLLGTGPATRRR